MSSSACRGREVAGSVRVWRWGLRLIAVLIVMTPLPSLAAQSATGKLEVVVRDSSGAAIPGVAIRLINEGTSAALDEISDVEGA